MESHGETSNLQLAPQNRVLALACLLPHGKGMQGGDM